MEICNSIEMVVNNENLAENAAKSAMRAIMSGDATPAQISALLIALRMKGETIEEISAFASIMREFCTQIDPNVDKRKLIDTCGTGGDKIKTFNISTIASFVISGAGIPVAKHGNRAVSSKCGSADILEGLGVNINASAEIVEHCIEKIGIGFMFAPIFHPAMKYAMKSRREIGIRTVFNILGPLTNPANAKTQILGVYTPYLTEKMANVLNVQGVDRAFVVHGLDGLDEIGSTCETQISELNNGHIETYTVAPEDFGIKRAQSSEIQGGDLAKNIEICFQVLRGNKGSTRDIVLLNASAGILVGGKVETITEGIEVAEEVIDSGIALRRLKELVIESKGSLSMFEDLEAKY
ncbi:MAG: anthranilate phosphoribosyltransferase [Promethearchaeota archaeon]